jgi:hypothetical protein
MMSYDDRERCKRARSGGASAREAQTSYALFYNPSSSFETYALKMGTNKELARI